MLAQGRAQNAIARTGCKKANIMAAPVSRMPIANAVIFGTAIVKKLSAFSVQSPLFSNKGLFFFLDSWAVIGRQGFRFLQIFFFSVSEKKFLFEVF